MEVAVPPVSAVNMYWVRPLPSTAIVFFSVLLKATFTTAGEAAANLCADGRRRTLSMWARKEALLKAVGVGLALDPQLVELEGPKVVAAPPELGEARDWTLVALPLPGHAAVLALKGPFFRLLLYDARPAQGGRRREVRRPSPCPPKLQC